MSVERALALTAGATFALACAFGALSLYEWGEMQETLGQQHHGLDAESWGKNVAEMNASYESSVLYRTTGSGIGGLSGALAFLSWYFKRSYSTEAHNEGTRA